MRPRLLQITEENADDYYLPWLTLYRHDQVNPFFFKPQDYPDVAMRELYNSYINSSLVLFFAYKSSEGNLIGTARMTFFENDRSHVVMLNAVAIHPNFHGKGYGTQFLKELIEFIKSEHHTKGITQIELAYEGDNPAARHFYEDKLGFVRKLAYEDWWIRFEPNFQKQYFWYARQQCCVLPLKPQANAYDSSHLLCDSLENPASLDKVFSVFEDSELHKEGICRALKNSYCGLDLELLASILRHEHQKVYYLKNMGLTKALLVFRAYGDEPRLQHAVTMPCVVFVDDLSLESLAAFIYEAMTQYRKENPKVFHFATDEEDAQESWYTEKHPKINILAKALQLAGFRFLGCFENYFNSESPMGAHLFGFSAVFLGFKEAIECLEKSTLNSRAKRRLTSMLSDIQLPSTLRENEKPPQFSDRAKYEIYRIIRTFAYPQDYTFDEKKLLIEQSCALLKLDPSIFIRVLDEQTYLAKSDLFAPPEDDYFETKSEEESSTSLENN